MGQRVTRIIGKPAQTNAASPTAESSIDLALEELAKDQMRNAAVEKRIYAELRAPENIKAIQMSLNQVNIMIITSVICFVTNQRP